MNNLDSNKNDTSISDILNYIDLNENKINNASFDLGLSGIALFYFYYASYSGNSIYSEKGLDCLKRCIEMLSDTEYVKNSIKYKTDSFDNHLSSFGRVLLFINNNFKDQIDAEDLYLSLDEILVTLIKSKIEIKDFDIDSGALSSGYYFLARYRYSEDKSKFKNLLERIVEGLEDAQIEVNSEEIYWSSPSMNNTVYLGISHGSAMIINFLSKMIIIDVLKEKSEKLLKKAINFVLNQKRDQINGAFPNCYPAEPSEPTQFSQCYGDLGIGYSLYIASLSLNDEIVLNEAMAILMKCVERKKEDNLTKDASIIYGASGVGHLFKKLANIEKSEELMKAANYWFEQITSYQNDQSLYAGYQCMFGNLNDIEWGMSFGWGISGIGITLMKYDNKSLPNLEELLMIGPD